MTTTTTEFPASYMRLRTLLDALVVNTLRYCLDGDDVYENVSRMKGVEGDLLNMIAQVGGDTPCDPGYFNCGGVCVPYACIEQFAEQSSAAE